MKGFKEGQWVFSVIEGWVKVTADNNKGNYPIVTYNRATDIYTSYLESGRRYRTDKLPTIYHNNPFDPNDRPPCEFKEGEIIGVLDGSVWFFREFDYMTESGLYRCRCEHGLFRNYKVARKLTPKERGE